MDGIRIETLNLRKHRADKVDKEIRSEEDLNVYDKYGQPYDSVMLFSTRFVNYYFTYMSLMVHYVIMGYYMDFWCNYSKLAMCYTFQFTMLHCFTWAIPDRRFSEWVKQKKTWFYVFAILNMVAYVVGLLLGSLMYFLHPDGMVQYLGLAIGLFQAGACTLMMVVLIVSMLTLRHRFDYEERMFNDSW